MRSSLRLQHLAKAAAVERAQTLMDLSATKAKDLLTRASHPTDGEATRMELKTALEAIKDSHDRVLFRARYGSVLKCYF